MSIKFNNEIYCDKKAMLDIVTNTIAEFKTTSKLLEMETEQGFCYRNGKRLEGKQYEAEMEKMKIKSEVLTKLFKGEYCEKYILDSRKEVSNELAKKIIETREPLGKFYTLYIYPSTSGAKTIENVIYVGIDNSVGHAWVEDFKTEEECLDWLDDRELENELEI